MRETSNIDEDEVELKPIHSDMGILSRSDGSAIFCQGIRSYLVNLKLKLKQYLLLL